MKCKHCGKELIAMTVYMEADSAYQLAGAALCMPSAWQPIAPMGMSHFQPANPAAAANPTYTVPLTVCAHEPAIDPINATGATNGQRVYAEGGAVSSSHIITSDGVWLSR